MDAIVSGVRQLVVSDRCKETFTIQEDNVHKLFHQKLDVEKCKCQQITKKNDPTSNTNLFPLIKICSKILESPKSPPTATFRSTPPRRGVTLLCSQRARRRRVLPIPCGHTVSFFHFVCFVSFLFYVHTRHRHWESGTCGRERGL